MYRYLLSVVVIVALSVSSSSSAGISPNGPDLQASITKCAHMGYSAHSDLMTSCVRAVRADYCGDGASHTSAGTLINLYDKVGIQVDAANWRPEAEWTPRGASCVSSVEIMRRGQTAPACSVPVRASCGSRVSARASVITELDKRDAAAP